MSETTPQVLPGPQTGPAEQDQAEPLPQPVEQAALVRFVPLAAPEGDDKPWQIPRRVALRSEASRGARIARLGRTILGRRRPDETGLQADIDGRTLTRYKRDGELAARVTALALAEYPVYGMGAEPEHRRRAAALVTKAAGAHASDTSLAYRLFGAGYDNDVLHSPGLREAWAGLYPRRRTPEQFAKAFQLGFEAAAPTLGFDPDLDGADRLIRALPAAVFAVRLSDFGISVAEHALPDDTGGVPLISDMILTEFGVALPLLQTNKGWKVPASIDWLEHGARRNNVLIPSDEVLADVQSGLAAYIDDRTARIQHLSNSRIDYILRNT